MSQDQGASARADRAATASQPSQSSVVSGTAGIPCAFTPGPWRASPYSSIVGIGVLAGGGRIIASVAVAPGFNPTAKHETDKHRNYAAEVTANARLIAAAPEMHRALLEARLALETLARRVFNDNGDHTINTEPLDPDVYSACYYAARTVGAALAKARGQ